MKIKVHCSVQQCTALLCMLHYSDSAVLARACVEKTSDVNEATTIRGRVHDPRDQGQSQLYDNQFISEQTHADNMLDSYNKVIGTILDPQAPFDTLAGSDLLIRGTTPNVGPQRNPLENSNFTTKSRCHQ